MSHSPTCHSTARWSISTCQHPRARQGHGVLLPHAHKRCNLLVFRTIKCEETAKIQADAAAAAGVCRARGLFQGRRARALPAINGTLGHHGGTDGWIIFKCTFYKGFLFYLLNTVTKTDISGDTINTFLFCVFRNCYLFPQHANFCNAFIIQPLNLM